MPDNVTTSSGRVRIVSTKNFKLVGDVIGNTTYSRATGTILTPDEYANLHHRHELEDVEGLIEKLSEGVDTTDLELKGRPTTPTPPLGDNSNQVANTEFVNLAINNTTIQVGNIEGLHIVATSGDYNDLKNRPISMTADGGTSDVAIAVRTSDESTNNSYHSMWFSSTSGKGRMAYDTNFEYNPYTNTLKVDRITGTAANATNADSATHDGDGNVITSTYLKSLRIEGTLISGVTGAGEVIALGNTQDNNTTYGLATTDEAGLMSKSDKAKLDLIEASANNYTLPKATDIVLGGVKIGSNITVNNGVISISKRDIVNALGYDPADSSSTGPSVAYPLASDTENGLMSSTDKVKLDHMQDYNNSYHLISTTNRSSNDPTYTGLSPVIERTIAFTSLDAANNVTIDLPITTIENVEGAIKTVNGASPDANGNINLDLSNINGNVTINGNLNVTGEVTDNSVVTITEQIIPTTDWYSVNLKPDDLETNTYIVQINAFSTIWSGIMSWNSNTDSNLEEEHEIILHKGSYKSDENLFLRTKNVLTDGNGMITLQVACSKDLTTASTFVFKFKKVF